MRAPLSPVSRCPAAALFAAILLVGCGQAADRSEHHPQSKRPMPLVRQSPARGDAPAPEATGGFDGARAFGHVERLVAIGPRQPGSEGSRKAQEYIRSTLRGYGCPVEEDAFQASTPRGRVGMKNLLAKIPGRKADIVLLMTHYDTYGLAGFVGANDSGSSTGLMLEMARHLCPRESHFTIWIAFLDGEEAFVEWSETDGTYGSRQLAAKMALGGQLQRTRAVILADLIGDTDLNLLRETYSTRWLVDLIWNVARRLGYQKHFREESMAIEDDHIPFIRRGVAAVDLIDMDYPPWHTVEDTLDKISARSIAIVGHVILESLSELEKKFP